MMAGVNIKSFKKIVPMIYAYNTPGIPYHEGWTKIGYTEAQSVEDRIRQQTHTAGIRWTLAWKDNAMFKDGSSEYFTDHDFHSYLETETRTPREAKTEWFQIDGAQSLLYFNAFASRTLDKPSYEKLSYSLRQEQADDLRKIGDRFQTSRTYAEEDTRSQAAILAADKRILLRKRAELQNMLRTPGLDADVARDANEQLRAVNSQLRGLKQAEQRYAAERKAALADQLASLRQAKAPNLQGAWSHVQGSVKILARAYESRAKKIAAAAEKGDTKSLERLIRSQENTARNMDRINHTGTQAQEYTAKAAAAARAVAAAKAKQKSGEEASAKASAAKAKSDKAAAASAQANAAAAKKSAAAAKAQSNKAKATKTTDLRPQLNAATTALSRAEATLRSIAELLPRLTAAADSIAATATNLAAGLTSRVAAAEARLKSLSALVTSLKRR